MSEAKKAQLTAESIFGSSRQKAHCVSKEGSWDSFGPEFQQFGVFEWALWSFSHITFIGGNAALEVEMSQALLNYSLLFWEQTTPCHMSNINIESISCSNLFSISYIVMHEDTGLFLFSHKVTWIKHELKQVEETLVLLYNLSFRLFGTNS